MADTSLLAYKLGWEKGDCENNHAMIRRILPKGSYVSRRCAYSTTVSNQYKERPACKVSLISSASHWGSRTVT